MGRASKITAADTSGDPIRYYPTVVIRRVRHYVKRCLRGYTNRGSLETAATEILRTGAERGFRAGSHFPGVWPRDLCFAASGLTDAGFGEELRAAAEGMLDAISSTFYTEFHHEYNVATPAEGVDTFPALTILIDETGGLNARAEDIAALATLHRRKFFDEGHRIVSGNGSSWWDSAAHPRETYNTAMLLAAVERLECQGIETTYTGSSEAIRDGIQSCFWNGRYFDERRGSSIVACDANVVPLYFGLVDDGKAARIVDSLGNLETEHGLKMRALPFGATEVRPVFLLHRDYHYHIWPWNSCAYANGLTRYGFDDRARQEVMRIERILSRYGNFLEVITLNGEPYVKRGYAGAEDFIAAAALWTEFNRRSDRHNRLHG